MPRGGEAVPATAASGRVRAVGARERLAKLVLSVPALWLVPAATLHPSRRGQRWQAALAAAGIDPMTRGEQLEIEAFARIAEGIDWSQAETLR